MACPYGASVKAGVDPDTRILVDRSLWETVTGAPSSWLDPILDTFTFETIKASDLCALNLSDPGTPDIGLLLSSLLHDPWAISTLGAWVREKLEYIAFTNACVCNAGTPVCDFNGPWDVSSPVAYTTGTFCYSVGFTPTVAAHVLSYVRVTHQAGWSGTPHAYLWKQSDHSLVWDQVLPAYSGGAGTDDLAVTTPPALTSGVGYVLGLDIGSGHSWDYWLMSHVTHNSMFTGNFGGVASSHAFGTYPDDTSEPWWHMTPVLCSGSAPTPPPAPTVPSQPATVQVPPAWDCATACDIMTRLQQVSDRIEWLRRDVTLIQRQHVPFAYIAGTPSSGLTGHGSIAVQGILGAMVTLTTVPLRWGQTDDTPRRLIPKVGSLAFGDSSGVLDEQQVHYDNQIMLNVPGSVTAIEWSFRPGVVATVTPLYREA